jgi:RNA polymerase sigma-70 factor (ECF subfamily)
LPLSGLTLVQRALSQHPPFLFAVGTEGALCYSASVRDASTPSLPREALDQLDALYRLARHLTGNDDDANDLVQETYARAYASVGRFVAGSNVRAWLFRILRNLFVDSYRRERSSPVRAGLEEDDQAAEGVTSTEPLRGDDELERLRGVVAEDIESALRSLSVDARAIVLLDLEGLTETELAEVLGCSLGTVKSRLSRARAKLRERLRDYAR